MSHLPLILSTFFVAASVLGIGQHQFGVGGRSVLCVPESDMDLAVLPYDNESIDLNPSTGRIPGFSFLFQPEMIKLVVRKYATIDGFDGDPYPNALYGSVGFLAAEDKRHYGPAMRARNVEDEWYARGNCPNATAREIVGAALFEAKCGEEADSAIWNRKPDPKSAMPDPNLFVVATCFYEHILLGPYQGKNLKTCSRTIVMDRFLVYYKFQKENIGVVSELDSFVHNKLVEWKANCSSSGPTNKL